MSNNVTREQHLQSLASAAQQFALSTQADTLSLVIEAFQAAGSSSAASTTTLTTPNLSLGEWSKDDTTYTASLSYSGDGTLSTNIGSISGTTLSVTDEDGIFSGVVTATAGTSYAATKLNFSYTTEDTGGGGERNLEVSFEQDLDAIVARFNGMNATSAVKAFRIWDGGYGEAINLTFQNKSYFATTSILGVSDYLVIVLPDEENQYALASANVTVE